MSALLRSQQLHHSSLPPTHTYTHTRTDTQQPPSNPVRFPANSKVGSRLEHFSRLATSHRLFPLVLSLASRSLYLCTSVLRKPSTKKRFSQNNDRVRKLLTCDVQMVRRDMIFSIFLEEAWNMYSVSTHEHVSILNVKNFLIGTLSIF